MTEDLQKAYFNAWYDGQQVSESEARASQHWSVGYTDLGGLTRKRELMIEDQLVMVWYAVGSIGAFGEVSRRARREYPDAPALLEHGFEPVMGYTWKLMLHVDASGTVTGCCRVLCDCDGYTILTSSHDSDGIIMATTKLAWRDGVQTQIFEYDAKGTLLHVGAIGDDDRPARFEDPAFYEQGWTLPLALGPDARMPAIPSLRELGFDS